ncbi:MAG TPA: response regulator transcription factor [Thermoanaerobaculia bacterium]|nr:response regulator transcription factor [Thermoanaerobaculia bacterium]
MKSDPRILVVDPDQDERDLVLATAKSLSAECDWCTNADDALREIAEHDYDAILLDVLMNDHSGYELCRALKADPESSDVPILFATTRNRAEDVLEGFQSLAFDFLVKPYRPRELRARLANAIRLRGLLEEMKLRVRFYERVLRVGRGLAAARTPAETAQTITRELEGVVEGFGARGATIESGGGSIFSAGVTSGPPATEIPFEHSGVEGTLRLWRDTPADPEERVRLADISAIVARGMARHGIGLRTAPAVPR